MKYKFSIPIKLTNKILVIKMYRCPYNSGFVFVSLMNRILPTNKLGDDIVKIIVSEFLGYNTFLSLIKLIVNDLIVEQYIMSTMIVFMGQFAYAFSKSMVFNQSVNLVNAFNKLQNTKVCKLHHPKIHECITFLTSYDIFAANTDSHNKLSSLLKFTTGKGYQCERNKEWCANLCKILSSMFKKNGTITLPPHIRSRSMVKIIEEILHTYFDFSVRYIPKYNRYSTVFMLSSEHSGKKLSFSYSKFYSLNSIRSILNLNRTCKI